MNKKNDKNNKDFANCSALEQANIFELDAKFLEVIGGGASGEFESPTGRG